MSLDRDRERRASAAENLFQHGRLAVKNGERERGRQLLLQAVDYDRNHAEAWLWLSATTDDPQEQKSYLEWAIAADPANAAAKRGLGLLTGKINKAELLPEGAEPPTPEAPPAPQPAAVERTFECPRCGAPLAYAAGTEQLECGHCGYSEVIEAKSARGQAHVLDFALPTVRGHRWAVGHRLFRCRQCGASTVVQAGSTSEVCPFCGAAALLAAEEDAEMLPPQAILPMRRPAATASADLAAWLKQGFFIPDDLARVARGQRLQPVYAPAWCFDATLNARWKARVAVGEGRSRRWEWRTGERIFFYTSHLQPGTRSLPAALLRQAEPFDLAQAVEYQPAFVAGWPAGSYDVSLAQASLEARESMIKDAARQLRFKAAPGHDVAELSVTSSDFTGMTFQLVLLPLWVGAYQYRQKTYRVLVNGQTGKVAGERPTDWVKVWLLVVAGLVLVGVPLAGWLLLR
jgi:ribosomal protein S27AE